MRTAIAAPGLLQGDYPERRPTPPGAVARGAAALGALGGRLVRAVPVAAVAGRRRDAAFVARVRSAEAALDPLDADTARTRVRAALRRDGLDGPALVPALALASLAAQRALGLRPFDPQLLAARAVLAGRLAEMATGEGKTLAVALAAAVGALAGLPVHVVTANDYLVARDAERLQPLFAALGLVAGAVVQADPPAARAAAYACDVAYVTARELVFDYLRDGVTAAGSGSSAPRRRRDALAAPLARLQPGAAPAPALLRGLCLAIVDEADAVLLDEARVPLILSQPADAALSQQHAGPALAFARTLVDGVDFRLQPAAWRADLTDDGRRRLDAAAPRLADASASPAWRHRVHREHAVCTALVALHVVRRDRHYVVVDGSVRIVDDNTGRVADGRAWSHGLQQLVELKEGCRPTPPMATLAQLTYQRFFPRYLRLGGVSGTLCDAHGELSVTYGVHVRRVPLRRPSRRRVGPSRLFADQRRLFDAVATRVAVLQRSGRPVLVATESVAAAQALSDRLAADGVSHAVLHARQDGDEARIVARAGHRGAVTVTTNLAGRGTDIALGPGVEAIGGLHVLCCQLNGARRIDRQLAGRAARQGDPGSVETWLSLDAPLLVQGLPDPLRAALARVAPALPSWCVRRLARWPQSAEERVRRLQRRRLIAHDAQAERRFGFAGPPE